MSERRDINFGMVGLGRMGANIVRRLREQEIHAVVFDVNSDAVHKMAGEGSIPSEDFRDFVERIQVPRVVWLMVPAPVTNATIVDIAEYLEPGDTIIDGGNSFYKNDAINAELLSKKGIHFVDVGTSGGIYGLERGYSLMIGGEKKVVESLTPILEALAPGFNSAPRTVGRDGDIGTSEVGYFHCGPVGAGHFVKMVHNGIEYGMMAAFAEGLGIFEAAKDSGPGFDLDIPEITEVWRRGSVVASWLLDLTAQALQESPSLSGYSTEVSDSGEGRWTVETAIESGVPVPVLSASLFSRFSSRGNDDFTNRVLSAMRYKFGGHNESPKKGS